MRRILLGIPIGLLLLFGALGIYTRLHWSAAGATYPAADLAGITLSHRLRDGAEHDAARSRNGGNPYILEIDVPGEGALLYYGASHTQDPGDPQIADITRRWQAFKPTVALYEGRSRGFFFGSLIEPFAGLPEPALVHKLARAADVPLYTLEPEYADEVGALLESFTPEQVALYFFLRVYASEAGGQANDGLALDLLGKRTDVDGLRGSITTLEDLDRIWARDFPDRAGWRVEREEPGYLAGISDVSRRLRGEHMAKLLITLVRRGERVLAVVGSGHVIRQEWNLRAALNQPPAWDQPESASGEGRE